MGASLVKRALVADLDHHLPVASLRALVVMAVTAKDTDADPVYFAGWGVLAIQMGYADDPEGRTAKRRVARAMADLVDRGLVKPGRLNPHTRNREYRLTLPL